MGLCFVAWLCVVGEIGLCLLVLLWGELLAVVVVCDVLICWDGLG